MISSNDFQKQLTGRLTLLLVKFFEKEGQPAEIIFFNTEKMVPPFFGTLNQFTFG